MVMLLCCCCVFQVDAAGFETAMDEARQKSRAAGKKTGVSVRV